MYVLTLTFYRKFSIQNIFLELCFKHWLGWVFFHSRLTRETTEMSGLCHLPSAPKVYLFFGLNLKMGPCLRLVRNVKRSNRTQCQGTNWTYLFHSSLMTSGDFSGKLAAWYGKISMLLGSLSENKNMFDHSVIQYNYNNTQSLSCAATDKKCLVEKLCCCGLAVVFATFPIEVWRQDFSIKLLEVILQLITMDKHLQRHRKSKPLSHPS